MCMMLNESVVIFNTMDTFLTANMQNAPIFKCLCIYYHLLCNHLNWLVHTDIIGQHGAKIGRHDKLLHVGHQTIS